MNTRIHRIIAATLVASLVLVLVGCGDSGDDASGDTTTTEAPADDTTTTAVEETTTTTAAPPPPEGAPSEPLQPSDPTWTAACEKGDLLITQAWQLEDGTLTDKSQVAVSMLQMINEIPEGTADAEITFVTDLINAFVGGEELTSYQADFRPNAEALLGAVAMGCGTEDSESLPLPEDSIGEMESFLFS